jgi:hypothetical protein
MRLSENAKKSTRPCSAAERKKGAFDKHLATQTGTRGSEGEPHGHFALACGSLREEKICHVGRGDGEHQ